MPLPSPTPPSPLPPPLPHPGHSWVGERWKFIGQAVTCACCFSFYLTLELASCLFGMKCFCSLCSATLPFFSFSVVVTRVSQTFCNSLVTWGTIWQLCEDDKPNSTVMLSKCFSSDLPPVLGLLAWSLRFIQLEQNVLNHLVTVLWSNAPSPFTQ